MSNFDVFKRDADESEEAFCERVFKYKDFYALTWKDVAEIINNELNLDLSSDAYRKRAYKNVQNQYNTFVENDGQYSLFEQPEFLESDVEFEIDELIKEKQKLKDERVQINSLIRRITREDTLKEMVKDAVSLMNDKFLLIPNKIKEKNNESNKIAILQLSDLHYGIEINNYWNKYDTQICCDRLSKLLLEVKEKCEKNNVSKLIIVNLGDLIAGRIHTPLRINSRLDVVTQTQHVAELLAQFISILSETLDIEYFDCLDNHSRIEPIKENNIDLESLSRFVGWYLKERLRDFANVKINVDNTFAPDIIAFSVFNHKVIGVHGDKDKPSGVIQNLSLMTQQHYDLVLTSHRHHFSADEVNQTLLLSNGSIMGTDEYAEKLRLSAKASQNLIIVSEENVMDTFYRIVLN